MYGKQSNLSLSGSGGDVSDSHDFNQFLKASNKDDENKLFKKTMPATSKLTEKYGLKAQSQQPKGMAQKGGQIYGQGAYSQQQIAQIPNMGGYQAAAQGMYADQYDENMYYDSYGQDNEQGDQYEFVDEYGNKYYDDGQGYMIDEQGYAYEYPEQIVEHDPYAFDVNLEEKKDTKKASKQPTTTKKSKKEKESQKNQKKEEEDDEATKYQKRKEQLEAKRKALQEQEEAEKKKKKEQEEEQKKREQEELIRQMNLNKQQNQKGSAKMPFKKSLDIADAYQSIDEDDIEDSRHNAQSEQITEEQDDKDGEDEIEEESINKPQLYDIDQTSKYYAQRTSELNKVGGIGRGKSKENLTDSNLYDSSAEKFGESSGRYGDPALTSSKNVINPPISESGELEEKSKDYNLTSSSKLGQSSSQQYPPQQEVYDPDIMAKYMKEQQQKQQQLSPQKKEEKSNQQEQQAKKDGDDKINQNQNINNKQTEKLNDQISKQDENQKIQKKEEIKSQQQIGTQENNKQNIVEASQNQLKTQVQDEKNNQINNKLQNQNVNDKQFSFEDIDHQQQYQNQQDFNNNNVQQQSKFSPQMQKQDTSQSNQYQYQQKQQQIFQKNIQNGIRVIEEETEVQVLQLELQQLKEKYAESYQKNILYQNEADQLVQQLEFAEKKGKQLQTELANLKSDNDNKMRVLKDRKEYFENIQENRAIQEIKQEFDNDRENLLFEVEKLRDELEYTQKQLDKQQQKTVDFKKIDFMRNQQNAETKQLKQKVVELETIIEERNQFIKSQKKFKSMFQTDAKSKQKIEDSKEDEEEDEEDEEEIQLEFEKELEIQEILIKGYQKENEKLYDENKQLQQKIQEYASKIFDENQKITNVQMKLAKQQGLFILADEEPNVRTLNELSSDIVISQNDLRGAQQRIIQMQEHIENLNKIHEEKEIEMKYEIDKLRQNKMQLELKLEGLDLNKIKEDEIYYKQLEQQYQEMLNSQKGEIKDLKYKLTWYIENSENVNKKQEEIKEKENRIQELQQNIENILSDPNSNMDKKTKQFQNMMLRDQQRIKQLERDIKQLEETLVKKNPQALKQIQVEKEEKSQLQEYKKKISVLEADLQKKTEEYELKVNEFRIEFDKMQLGFQQKLNEVSQSQQQHYSENTKNNEKLQMVQSQKVKFLTHDSFFKQNDNDDFNNNNNQIQISENTQKLSEDNQLLKERIKELEKEVNDAKNYYVKKVKNLKNGNNIKESSIPPKKQTQNNRPASSSGTRQQQQQSTKNNLKEKQQQQGIKKVNNFMENQDVEDFQQTQDMASQIQKYKKQIEELEQKLKDQAQQQLTNRLLTTLAGKQVNVDESVMILQQNLTSQEKQIKLLQQQQQLLLEMKEEFFGLIQILLKYLEKPLTAPILKINQFVSGVKEQCEFMEYNRLKTSLQNLIEFMNDLIKSKVFDKEIAQDFLNCLQQLSQYVAENGVTQIQWNYAQDSAIVLELRLVQLMGQFYQRNKVVTPTLDYQNININQKSNKNLKLMNNFMLDDSLQISDIKKINANEDNKENIDLHNQLTFLKDQIHQLQTQKQQLNTLDSQPNRNPNQMEFVLLEKKLEMLEQSYLRKEMEINFAINNYMNTTGGVGKQNITEIHQHYNMIINVLKKQIMDQQQEHQLAIQKKNSQIEECSQEVAKFMKEMTILKNIKQTYMK